MGRQKKQAGAEAVGAEGAGADGDKPASQKEAVRRAMKARPGASNTELQAYIQETFAMPLKRTNIATLKSQIKSESRSRGRGGRPRVGAEGYTLDDLRLVQELVQRVGAGRVRDMVDLFDK
jgi:hypothetical protein